MKIRNGFVSNSSVSSFICVICREEFTGQDLSPSDVDCVSCDYGHIMCKKHLKDMEPVEPKKAEGCEHKFDRATIKFCSECGAEAWVEEEEDSDNELPESKCPVCQFKEYDSEEMAQYLEKTRSVSRDEVFAKVKAINKRRRKLYDEEYVTDVCQRFSLTDDILLKEIKDKFGNFKAYYDFINDMK